MRSRALFSGSILTSQQDFLSASSSRTARLNMRFITAIVRLTLAADLGFPCQVGSCKRWCWYLSTMAGLMS
ncbi:MAG: hypothetical protein NTY36_02645 [Deltaproteobacteria bacterium]|nr:hypothetical protein [Deltaproteobacteria bacterium]